MIGSFVTAKLQKRPDRFISPIIIETVDADKDIIEIRMLIAADKEEKDRLFYSTQKLMDIITKILEKSAGGLDDDK